MYKILITGSIHETGLEILRKEKDIEIQYAPELALAEIFKIIAPFHCILTCLLYTSPSPRDRG